MLYYSMNNTTKIYKYMLIYLYSYTSFSLSIYQHSNNPEKEAKKGKKEHKRRNKQTKNNKAAIVRAGISKTTLNVNGLKGRDY